MNTRKEQVSNNNNDVEYCPVCNTELDEKNRCSYCYSNESWGTDFSEFYAEAEAEYQLRKLHDDFDD